MYEIIAAPPSTALAATTRDLLDALPGWFGIPEANDHYVESATRLDGYLARTAGADVGVLLVARHFPVSAEVHLIAVAPDRHRTGIGRRLLDRAEADLRATGCRLLQVKTLGPSHPDEGYAATRRFYEARGFLPLEEMLELWDQNPCLLMIKPL